ncbi:MAG TPA: ATP-binding cassette domain-containing protein [Anaerolineae bacterium]|nr:ATP-binding cassette domain-containing protein [Anaerolineae bacterium]
MRVELQDIHKHFGPVRANDGVTLTVDAGTLHGLLGENGAGKSTLMKILSGFQPADSGAILLDGKPARLASPADAIRHGVGMLHQDPLVFLPFKVIDNFLLGSPGALRLDRAGAARELKRRCDQFGFALDPDASARSLTVGERQQLEIVRLLWLGARVLILDEPTTGISAPQRVKLFETLRTLAAQGMSVIFVSHKLEEVEELCGRVTVMRRGKVVGEMAMPCPAERLVEMMFGQVVVGSGRLPVQLGEPALQVEHVSLRDNLLSINDLSLTVQAGEVIGLAGLEGSGQRTLLRACAGLLRPGAGRVRIGPRDLTGHSYREFLAAGVHYLPAGRLEEGLVAGMTLTEHFVLTAGARRFFVDWAGAQQRSADTIKFYDIKGRPTSTAEALSGGNQQRLLLAMFPPKLKLLLMEHPTRGLDIESAIWVWVQLLARRAHGTAILFASADLDELLQYSDRILVFFAGRVLQVLHAAETNAEQLGHLIGGKQVAAVRNQ